MKNIIILASLVPMLTFAQVCKGIDKNAIEDFEFLSKSTSSCDYVKEMSDEIIKIQSFAERPIPIKLIIVERNNNASFDGGKILQVPMQFVFTSEYGQEHTAYLSSVYSIVDHEYGHALLEDKFETELAAEFPDELGFVRENKILSDLKLNSLRVKSKSNLNKVDKQSNLITSNQNFTRFAKVSTPYSELYADVVAVYNANDKSAMLKALYFDEMSNFEFQLVQTRSFETEFKDSHSKYMTEEHGYFALTRNYIGKNLWPKNVNQKQEFLKILGDAIVEEVREILISKSDLPKYEIANKNLIKRIEMKLNQNK